MKIDIGIVCSVKVHLINNETEDEAAVDFDHGLNQVPTRSDLENYRLRALNVVSNSTNTSEDEWRLSTLEDRGFAEPHDLKWRPE